MLNHQSIPPDDHARAEPPDRLHQDAALIAGKVISLQTQLSVCGLCSKGNLVQTVFGIINQDCTRIFYGLSGRIGKSDLDNRSLLSKPYLA